MGESTLSEGFFKIYLHITHFQNYRIFIIKFWGVVANHRVLKRFKKTLNNRFLLFLQIQINNEINNVAIVLLVVYTSSEKKILRRGRDGQKKTSREGEEMAEFKNCSNLDIERWIGYEKNRKSISSIVCLFAQLTEYSGSFF